MLAIDFLEFLGGLLWVFLLVEKVEALIVEPVGGLVGQRPLLLEKIEAAASRQGRRRLAASNITPTARAKRRPCFGRDRRPRACDLVLPRRGPAGKRLYTRVDVNEITRLRQAISGHSARIKARFS